MKNPQAVFRTSLGIPVSRFEKENFVIIFKASVTIEFEHRFGKIRNHLTAGKIIYDISVAEYGDLTGVIPDGFQRDLVNER